MKRVNALLYYNMCSMVDFDNVYEHWARHTRTRATRYIQIEVENELIVIWCVLLHDLVCIMILWFWWSATAPSPPSSSRLTASTARTRMYYACVTVQRFMLLLHSVFRHSNGRQAHEGCIYQSKMPLDVCALNKRWFGFTASTSSVCIRVQDEDMWQWKK